MKLLFCFIFSFFALAVYCQNSTQTIPVKNVQKTYTHVREAYSSKEKLVVKALADQGISRDSVRIYIMAFKTEKKLEIWAKNVNDTAYCLIRKIPICEISGDIGPKRRVKDLQVPEGFYHINGLNPFSKYYLSMQINYPNASDSIRGTKGHLGNAIFIHGNCLSSGCIAITDEYISELYVYVLEAYNSGQEQIDITIYPAYLSDKVYDSLMKSYKQNKDYTGLWTDLKKSYDLFKQTQNPPRVTFLPDGSHEVQ